MIRFSFFVLVLSSFFLGVTAFAKTITEKITPSQSIANMTIMVYMGADNSLDKAAYADLNEMQKFGTPNGVELVFFHDGLSSTDTFRGFIKKGEVHLEQMGEVNSADPRMVVGFVKWAAQMRPAKKYMLVMWDHGYGVLNAVPPLPVVITDTTRKPTVPGVRSIINDDTSWNEISFTQFRDIMKAIKTAGIKIDILGFDACLMGMAEMAYEMADFADVLIASEETEPGAGWPYDTILSSMNSLDSKEIGKLVVSKYIDSYKSVAKSNVTLSAIDLKAFKTAIDKAFTPFVKGQLMTDTSLTKTVFLKDIALTQKFAEASFVDMPHLINNINSKFSADILKWLKPSLISTGKLGNSVKNAFGFSIYAPKDAIVKTYLETAFAQNTGWGALLKAKIGKVIDPKYMTKPKPSVF